MGGGGVFSRRKFLQFSWISNFPRNPSESVAQSNEYDKILKKRKFPLEILGGGNLQKIPPKNPVIWYIAVSPLFTLGFRCHRQKIIGWLNDPLDELTLTEAVLGEDAKNYHAWQYRQWVITTFSLWDKELDYVHKLLMEDIRNNSAWNQRHFVIAKTTGYTSEVLSTEVKYVDNTVCVLIQMGYSLL